MMNKPWNITPNALNERIKGMERATVQAEIGLAPVF